jgi:predicted metalloprotease
MAMKPIIRIAMVTAIVTGIVTGTATGTVTVIVTVAGATKPGAVLRQAVMVAGRVTVAGRVVTVAVIITVIVTAMVTGADRATVIGTTKPETTMSQERVQNETKEMARPKGTSRMKAHHPRDGPFRGNPMGGRPSEYARF